MKAYVLMAVQVGKSLDIQEEMRSWGADGGVLEVDAVAGTYDVVAVVEAPDAHAIGEIVMGRVQKLDGVSDTVTLLAIG
jgi:uncharacterized protein with GYD domain